jgi:signal peptidase I
MRLAFLLGSGRRATVLFVALAVASAYHAQPVRLVVVMGESMEPAYKSGEWALAVRYHGQALHPGDVVVAETPAGTVVKRVKYTEGARVRQAFFDGWTDDLSPAVLAYSTRHTRLRTLEVPAGHVYLRGDNVVDSVDSRHYGPVALSDVLYVVSNPKPPCESGF